jgi:endonuclease/exonuclease/phosphatase family metal-dependent hydrolase
MRVVTLNVWNRGGDWPARRALLIAGFRALAPDLVALQETVVDDAGDQVRDVLGDGFEVVHSRRRSDDGTGVSIASRWPIAAVEEIALEASPRDDGFPCTTLVVTVQAPGIDDPVRFVNHFPSWKPQQELERERQAVQAARRLQELEGHVVVAGDFDADPDAASIRFLTGRQSLDGSSVCYRDAWDSVHPGEPGHTYTPANPLMTEDWPFRRIDYILVRCGEHGGPMLAIRDCERIFDRPRGGVWASDHFGLVADLASQ